MLLSGRLNRRTFVTSRKCSTASGPLPAWLSTHRKWLRCSPATSLDLCLVSFSWPRNGETVWLDLSRLTYDRTRMVATLPVRQATSKDGTLPLHTVGDKSEQNS